MSTATFARAADRAGHSARSSPSRTLSILLVAPFLAQADATIANVATPSIQSDLGVSAAAGELVVGGYLVAYAVLLITGARLGQTFGYKRLYGLGLAVFGVSSLLAGLAPSAPVLIAARVIQGGGAALMYPQALTGIQLNFEGAARTRAVGLFAMALSAGAVGGQILGGLLISIDIAGTTWRPIFLVNVPIALIGLVFAARFLPADAPRGDRRLDSRGVATLSLTLLLLVVPLIVGRTEGWPLWSFACLAGSVPAAWWFLATQRRELRRGGQPLINVRVIRRRPVVLGLVGLFLATATYYALLFCLAQYFQHGLGRSTLASGLILVPWVAAFGAAGQIMRRLPARLAAMLPTAGYLLLALAYAGLAVAAAGTPPSDALLIVLLALGGLGLGVGFAGLIGHLADAVPPEYAPDISGVSTTALQIGGALGVAGFATVYLSVSGGAGDAMETTTGILALTVLAAAAAAFGATRPGGARTRSRGGG